MLRLDMKNQNTILAKKRQKYKHYPLKKLINMISYWQRNTTPRSRKSDRAS